MGGVLATAVAAPAVVVCCGGGGVLLAGVTGAVGLSAILGWTDYVLLPALVFFIALPVYAVWRRQLRLSGS